MKGDIAAYQILKDASSVNDLAKIYPLIAPEEVEGDFIVVSLENVDPSSTKTSSSKVDDNSVLLTIVSTGYETALQINDECRAVLDYYEGSISLSDGSSLIVDRAWLTNISSTLQKETSRTYYIIEAEYIFRMQRTPDYTRS